MRPKDPNIEKMEGQIREWGAKIESLLIGAETAEDHVRADCRRNARELRAEWFEAQARLERFRAAGTETWDAFRTGIEGAWMDLEAALKDIPHGDPIPKPPKTATGPRTAPSRLNFRNVTPLRPKHRSKKR